MRVIGVDPGLTRCGLSLIKSEKGRSVTALAIDVVCTSPNEKIHRRLLEINNIIEYWIEIYHPDAIVIERVFAQQNLLTVIDTAQVGGTVALSAARNGIKIRFYTPSEVKAAITGNGHACKTQVTEMIKKILALSFESTQFDATDALAIAICHCWYTSK